jgi:excinuclease ABC subunit B
MDRFHLQTKLELKGDQPRAIRDLVQGFQGGREHQVLLGVTGSGKTFTMANVINELNCPALVISPNKTLAGQLYNEFKELFPKNAVEFFVSYYDYYQPEAYVPATDTYIEKDAAINDRIDRMRHSATASLLERRDVIVVASVSCIYGIGSPQTYREMALELRAGQHLERRRLLEELVSIQYARNDLDFSRGTFRVRGEHVEIYPASSEDRSLRITFFDDEIEEIAVMDPLLGEVFETRDRVFIFPASHYTTPRTVVERAIEQIKNDLSTELTILKKENRNLAAERLEQRTRFDLEMLRETGFCSGIENYSRYLDGRRPGSPPSVLLDFFPEDYLLFIDESHIAVPQIRGMYRGDRSRKETLVQYGFRLSSALDNRPLRFAEFLERSRRTLYVSATPGDYEIVTSQNRVIEQIIRPTGLLDPRTERRPTKNQVDDLLREIRKVADAGGRILVTTLTKKMAERLTDYYAEQGVAVRYLHSDIQTIERLKILAELREGVFSVLIGINLLREGLDIPEVSLIGILEADARGFLRSRRSLIQIFGRAARNVRGRVLLYADEETPAIREALLETSRRRSLQEAYNSRHGITPESIIKSRKNVLLSIYEKDYVTVPARADFSRKYPGTVSALEKEIRKVRRKMLEEARKYRFEEAAKLRDRMRDLEKRLEEAP